MPTIRLSAFAMANFTLTLHAHIVLEIRRIDPAWVERVMAYPKLREADRRDVELTHAIGFIEEFGNRALRVVYNQTVDPPKVITAYFDRSMRERL